MGSFIENVNLLVKKIDLIEESNEIFDDGVIPVLEEIAELDLYEAVQDLKKGNYLGNRKIDINLALNIQGITQDLIDSNPDTAESIWTNGTNTVLYDRAFVTFVDGEVIEVPFIFDNNPTTVSTHGDLLIQFNNNAAFLAKLDTTLIAGFASPVVGEIVRIHDVIGQNSNIERIQLHAVSGNYIEENPIYFWAKTTSAFQTLSMRAGDIIKLGNDIDSIILLATSIEQVLEIQTRLPQLVDTFVNDVAQGDVTIYNKLTELDAIYQELTGLIAIYDDIKVGGTNYIQTASTNIADISSVAADLNLGVDSKIVKAGSNIDNINSVADNEVNINIVAANETDINSVATDIVPNLPEILEADDNAAIATAQAAIATNQAGISTQKAGEASVSAQAALDYLNEITGLSATAVQLTSSQNPTAVYNSANGVLTLGIPQGLKGDRGEAFDVDASGTIAGRSAYDGAAAGFAYLTLDENPTQVYFKRSDTSGDWSLGVPFGKGDKGDTGDTGNGILGIAKIATNALVDTYRITFTNSTTFDYSVTNAKSVSGLVFTYTTDASGLPAKSGATDTYTMSFNDGSTFSYEIYNGLDSAVTSVAGRTGDVVLTEADITGLDKYTKAEVEQKIDDSIKSGQSNFYASSLKFN